MWQRHRREDGKRFKVSLWFMEVKLDVVGDEERVTMTHPGGPVGGLRWLRRKWRTVKIEVS